MGGPPASGGSAATGSGGGGSPAVAASYFTLSRQAQERPKASSGGSRSSILGYGGAGAAGSGGGGGDVGSGGGTAVGLRSMPVGAGSFGTVGGPGTGGGMAAGLRSMPAGGVGGNGGFGRAVSCSFEIKTGLITPTPHTSCCSQRSSMVDHYAEPSSQLGKRAASLSPTSCPPSIPAEIPSPPGSWPPPSLLSPNSPPAVFPPCRSAAVSIVVVSRRRSPIPCPCSPTHAGGLQLPGLCQGRHQRRLLRLGRRSRRHNWEISLRGGWLKRLGVVGLLKKLKTVWRLGGRRSRRRRSEISFWGGWFGTVEGRRLQRSPSDEGIKLVLCANVHSFGGSVPSSGVARP